MTVDWQRLAELAWQARSNAHLYGTTAVGAAALSSTGAMFGGCNVEHRFRSHDIHAEVNAIGSMISGGETKLVAILVVAQRDRFTPCGACLDWIFEFGGADCLVGYQNEIGSNIVIRPAQDLMPFYPL
jgi:cytidine deaminase